MRLKSKALKDFQTSEDQLLVKINRKDITDLPNPPEIPSFSMSNSMDKEVKKGIVVCADEAHKEWEGKEIIIPIEGSIEFDTFVEIDDANIYEYRLVKIKNVMLIAK